ncbi:glycosyltransferase [Oscillatoria amoena NRMC-F 0135]|nr:glycosyltransferase [Oscillatoria amoena NRMC-F 0135]
MSQKINILHIIKSLGRGGAEMLLPETLKLHDRNRFEFHCIYFLPWKNQMVESIQNAGGKVTCINATNNVEIVRKTTAVIEYIRENNIKLIHCHLPWAGLVGRLVHRKTGVPVVYTEHNKQERYHFATRWMNRVSFNQQTAAIAVSEDVTESIKKNIHPRIPVHTIVNGVNTEYFRRDDATGSEVRAHLGIPENGVVVGTVAVFRFQKRLKEWIEVFHEASQENPNVYGIMVGDGPLKAELLQHRKRMALEEKVFMPGLQTDVKPWYSAMDVFMMTSVFEGLPIALLEAMSMQCAIVTTNAGGIKQVVRNGLDGVVVEVDEWKTLSNKLNELTNDNAKQKALGEAARKRTEEAFSLVRMVNELESLYHTTRLAGLGKQR